MPTGRRSLIARRAATLGSAYRGVIFGSGDKSAVAGRNKWTGAGSDDGAVDASGIDRAAFFASGYRWATTRGIDISPAADGADSEDR